MYAALFSTRARTGLTLESVANKIQQICKKEKGSEKVGGNGLLFAAPTLSLPWVHPCIRVYLLNGEIIEFFMLLC